MGMLLFDKSGTFTPSTYGLTVGDMLHIVAIGGGGSAGAAGGATSFGNLLSVAGGAAAGSFGYGGEGGWHPALPVTLCSAPPNDVPMGTVMYSNAGGCGCSKILLSGDSTALGTKTIYGSFAPLYGGAGYSNAFTTEGASEALTGTSQNGYFNGGKGCNGKTYSRDLSRDIALYLGGGGSGYGAGGGGGYAYSQDADYGKAPSKNGGAHGAFNWLDYVLTASSPTSFAITIGAGGAAGKVTGDRAGYVYYNYGAGASGCVAIYW